MAAASVGVGCGGPDRTERVENGDAVETAEVERPDGTFAVRDTLWSVGTLAGAPDEQFGGITDAAFDGDGNVYLLDPRAHLVRAFSPEGTFLWAFGRSGRGPGEFSALEAIEHDGETTLYVLDRVSGLMRFRTTPQGMQFEGAVNLAADGIEGTDFCFLGDRIYVYGLSSEIERGTAHTHVVHELTREGERLRSFGELFGEPAGHPVQRALSGWGRIACSRSSRTLLVASQRTSELRAHRPEDGGLLWSDTLPDFVDVWMNLDPPGFPPGAFSLGEAPGGSDRNVAFHPLGPDDTWILVQSRRQATGDPPSETVSSRFIDVTVGVCPTRSQDLPLILAISGRLAVAVEERRFPRVHLIEVSHGRLDER
ncbi:MAG: hypothetical protein WD960_09875 [Gemmatimonadota bacterium]